MNSCTYKTEKSYVASKASRFTNYVLDMIFFRILLFPTWFLIGYFATRLGVLDADSANWLTTPIVNWSLTIASLFFYYFAFETLWQRTPAKFITGTKVLNHDGTKPTARTIALRTLARFVPFEPLSFLGKEGCGWHDKWSGTAVVRVKTTQQNLADSLGEYGIEQPQEEIIAETRPETGMGLKVQSQMVTEERQRLIAEQSQTAIDAHEQKAKCVLLAFLVVCFIGVIAIRFSNTPAAIRANQIFSQRRDLSTPSSRLVGYWQGDHSLYYRPIDRSLGYGTYTWGNVLVQFKVVSESRSGTSLKTREFLELGGKTCCANVEYCIPKDGMSMTKEIVFDDGSHGLFKYSYVDGFTRVNEFGIPYRPID